MVTYEKYEKASKELFLKLFGKTITKKAKKRFIKLEWDGLDITTSKILATTASIKERFSPEWLAYESEKGRDALDLFIQSVFHYGMQQGIDITKEELDTYRENNALIMAHIDAENKRKEKNK